MQDTEAARQAHVSRCALYAVRRILRSRFVLGVLVPLVLSACSSATNANDSSTPVGDSSYPLDAASLNPYASDSSTADAASHGSPDGSHSSDGSSDDSAVVDSGTAEDAEGDRSSEDAATATFTEVYAIFTTGSHACTQHHSGAEPAGSLDLATKLTAFDNLVGIGASCAGGEVRVRPGNAADSFLYQKVAGVPPCGVRMPMGGPALSESQIQTIASWINGGARND